MAINECLLVTTNGTYLAKLKIEEDISFEVGEELTFNGMQFKIAFVGHAESLDRPKTYKVVYVDLELDTI